MHQYANLGIPSLKVPTPFAVEAVGDIGSCESYSGADDTKQNVAYQSCNNMPTG